MKMMEKIRDILMNNTESHFNSFDLFYSDDWNDLPFIEVNNVDIEDSERFYLEFIVNGQVALRIFSYGTNYVLSKYYSDFVYQWIVAYMCDNFNLSKDTVTSVITHEL